MRPILLLIVSFYFILGAFSQNSNNNGFRTIESSKIDYDYAKLLSNRADFYYSSGNYDKAIEYGEESSEILRRYYGEDNIEFALSLAQLAFYKYNNGEFKGAVELGNKALDIFEKRNLRESILYALISNHLSYYLTHLGEEQKSYEYKKEAKRLIKRFLGKEKIHEITEKEPSNIFSNYSETVDAIALRDYISNYRNHQYDSLNCAISVWFENSVALAGKQDYSNAINFCKKSLQIILDWSGEAYFKYRSGLVVLADFYDKSGNYEDSYRTCEKCSELTKKYCGEFSPDYAESISNYSYHLSNGMNYLKAIETEQKAIDILTTINDSSRYAESLSRMAFCHFNLGHIEKAIEYNKKTLNILDLLNQQSRNIVLSNTLENLSKCYSKTGEYEEAIILSENLIAQTDRNSTEYFRYLFNLADCYYLMEDYEKAIELLEGICEQEGLRFDRNSTWYSTVLETLSRCYLRKDRFRDAIWSQEKAIDIKKAIYDNKNIRLAYPLSFLGRLYRLTGDEKEGSELTEEAAHIVKKNLGTNSLDYVNMLRELGYSCTDYARSYTDWTKKAKILEEARLILENNSLGEHSVIIEVYEDLEECYANLGEKDKYQEIEVIVNKNKDIQSYLNSNNIIYADYLINVSKCYTRLGNIEKSDIINRDLVELYKKNYNNDITWYDNIIFPLAINACQCLDTIKLNDVSKLMKETNYFDRKLDTIIQNINTLSNNYRRNFWNNHKNLFDFIPLLALITEDDYYISHAFDISALFSKNLLLKTETKLSELIKTHGDKTLNDEYDSFLSNKSKLCLAYDKNVEDSIKRVITNQEDVMRQKMKEQGLLEQDRCSWKDIQVKLNRNDIVIEFLSLQDFNTGHGNYLVALLLKKEYQTPKLVTMNWEKIIDSIHQRNDMDSLYLSIWGPIESELVGINNVYFSPAGLIHNLPIEYFQNTKGEDMNEKYNIYRVSTTQKLLTNKKNHNYKSSILYGGLDYDFENTTKQDPSAEHHVSVDRGLRDLIMNRNGFDRLYNTEEEITEISRILSQSEINCSTFTGKNGIEETFKRLSGKVCDMIHMSTHGMYIDAEEATKQENHNTFLLGQKKNTSLSPEDAALSRSFLVMSGGNMLPKHHTVPDGVEDGILTAQEIANLDFKGLDLVVLSACQTALGDITSDGVYGLQRGFKKAGANTILMSLDKVDDEATKILMVEFYKNLMAGKTKHQSLNDAQKYLRQVDNGKYDKPEYWASFIMLDGLN